MKTEFTPGPWLKTYTGDGKTCLINRGRIGTVDLDDISEDEGEANVNLILAAPEMFEALELIVANVPPEKTIHHVALNALNRALGL